MDLPGVDLWVDAVELALEELGLLAVAVVTHGFWISLFSL